MDMDRVRIADVITTEYSDFLSFCSASGKIFISELTNVDFVAFRTSSGQSRDYIKSIRAMLDNPVVAATTEVDAVQKGSESEKNELQGDPFDAGEHLALEDQSTPSKTESPSWIQPNEQPPKNIEAALDETSCYDRKNDTENKTADRTTEEIVVTSTGTETTALNSTGLSDDSEYTLAYLFDVNPSWFEDVGIIALNLGVRPTNCLNNAKIKTIAEVLARTTDELKAIKNMGVKSVNEIVQKVKDYVSDPANLDVATISAVSNLAPKHERIELDPAFKSALEANKAETASTIANLADDFVEFFNNQYEVFCKALDRALHTTISADEYEYLFNKVPSGTLYEATDKFTTTMQHELTNFRKSKKTRKMYDAWEKATNSTSPADWSQKNGIPVLCLFTEDILTAQKIFDALNRTSYLPTEKDIDDAIDFLQSGKLGILKNTDICVKRFIDFFAGEYAYVITSADELRDQIRAAAGTKVYDWYAKANSCKSRIRQFATERYQLKYRSQAKERVRKLTAEQAQKYLDELIDKDPLLGINILKG